MVACAAELSSKNCKEKLLAMFALPALLPLKNFVKKLLIILAAPAVLLLKNWIKSPLTIVTLPPLTAMPAPMKLNTFEIVMVYASAQGLNVHPPTCSAELIVRLVWIDVPKKAVSSPVGSWAKLQLLR